MQDTIEEITEILQMYQDGLITIEECYSNIAHSVLVQAEALNKHFTENQH